MVFPLPVPPLMKTLYLAFTSFSRKAAASREIELLWISCSMVMGFSGNRLIVTIGPFSAMGFMTILTLAPSASLASTMGEASFTTRLHPATICCITS